MAVLTRLYWVHSMEKGALAEIRPAQSVIPEDEMVSVVLLASAGQESLQSLRE